MVKGVGTSDFIRQFESIGKSNAVSLSIGDIIIQSAEDANGLAGDIVKYLPNALLKEIYRN